LGFFPFRSSVSPLLNSYAPSGLDHSPPSCSRSFRDVCKTWPVFPVPCVHSPFFPRFLFPLKRVLAPPPYFLRYQHSSSWALSLFSYFWTLFFLNRRSLSKRVSLVPPRRPSFSVKKTALGHTFPLLVRIRSPEFPYLQHGTFFLSPPLFRLSSAAPQGPVRALRILFLSTFFPFLIIRCFFRIFSPCPQK